MQQITQLAQMLSSQNSASSEAPPPSPAASAGAESSPDLSGMASLLENIDFNTVSKFLPLLQEINRPQNDARTQLLHALKPFLKPERRAKVDTALRLAHLLHAGKTLFKGFGEAHV